jgi:hypothetical protein
MMIAVLREYFVVSGLFNDDLNVIATAELVMIKNEAPIACFILLSRCFPGKLPLIRHDAT